MALFLLWAILFLVSSGSSYQMQELNVKIEVNQSALTANVTWKLPTCYEVKKTWIKLQLFDSSGQRRLLSSPIRPPTSYYLLNEQLQQCMEYSVQLISFIHLTYETSITRKFKFVMTDMQYTSIFGSDVSIEWPTQSQRPYWVKSPSGTVIYEVSPSGTGTLTADSNKYSFGQKVSSIISLTVKQVNESDAGLYTSVYKFGDGNPDGCAFLIVTDKDEKARSEVSSNSTTVVPKESKEECTFNGTMVVAGALSAVIVLLLILIAVIIIKYRKERRKNQRTFSAQTFDVQANQAKEQAELNYMNEDWQACQETSPDNVYDPLGRRDKPNTYEAMRQKTSEATNETDVYTEVK